MSLKSDLLKQARFGGRLLVWGPPVGHEGPIKQLFANGEQGVWYDPSDLSTLFQDVAGTIPVTSDGDPVGLMLDKSQRLELGPELVTNGTFDSDIDGWTDQATALPNEWDAGRIKVYHSSSPTGAYTTIVTEPGKTYEFVGKLVSSTSFSGSTRLRAGNGTQPDAGIADSQRISEPGTYSLIFTAQSTTSYVYLRNDSGAVTLWDNISVRELHGNHATQSVSASRPTYRTDGTLHWLEFDGVDDYMQYPSLIALSLCAGIIAPAGSTETVFGQVNSQTNHVFTRDLTGYGVSVNGSGARNTGGISINGGDVFPSDLSGGDISYPAYPTYPINTKSTLLVFHGVTGDYDSLCILGQGFYGGHSIFSAIISDAYLTDNIQDINDYMNSKMGV